MEGPYAKGISTIILVSLSSSQPPRSRSLTPEQAEGDLVAQAVWAQAAAQLLQARRVRPRSGQTLRDALVALQIMQPDLAVEAPMQHPDGSVLTIRRLDWKTPRRPEASSAEQPGHRRKASIQAGQLHLKRVDQISSSSRVPAALQHGRRTGQRHVSAFRPGSRQTLRSTIQHSATQVREHCPMLHVCKLWFERENWRSNLAPTLFTERSRTLLISMFLHNNGDVFGRPNRYRTR
jgi:hypothetical protein